MTTLTDWNCQLLPSLRDVEHSPQRIALALEEMRQAFGISQFYLTPPYDVARESVTAFLHRRERIKESLVPHLSPSVSVLIGASVTLSPSVCEIRELDKLLTNRSHLCLSLPLCEYAHWVDFELNRLLFHRRLRPLFLSFERAVILYPEEAIERLMRIKGAAFQFSYRSLQVTKILNVIKCLLKERKTVLLGTGLDSPEKIGLYELPYYLDCAKRFFDERELCRLLSNGGASL
ncbi:MAG: hypothetical protein IJX13_05315 [Clostridia bacterium]|nr:hypothetical protein [Clostridia bacterium]